MDTVDANAKIASFIQLFCRLSFSLVKLMFLVVCCSLLRENDEEKAKIRCSSDPQYAK